MGFFKKIGGFFGRVWSGVKKGIGAVRTFIRDKILPTAKKIAPAASVIADVIHPGAGAVINKGMDIAERFSGSGSGT